MTNALGLSIGTANLVAASARGAPVIRRALLTSFPHRPPEVGVPLEKARPTESGLVLSGFVERVGDPVPLVAVDGSAHRGERLLADALEALTRAASPGPPPEVLAAAVPAHWRGNTVNALQTAVADRPVLSPRGRPMPLVSDAEAALSALRAQPGLPDRGIIVLVDLGATGTSITLADTAAGFRTVGDTVRYDEFCGDLIDQAVLRHLLGVFDVDPSNTSAVGSLSRVREQCRLAKERLSRDTATGFTGPLVGPHATVRLTRGELEGLLRDPLDGLLAVIDECLHRNNMAHTNLAAVATVGGGANIPIVTQRLSQMLRMPVTTWSRPELAAAFGAARIAQHDTSDEAKTGVGMAPAAATARAAAVTATATHPVAPSAAVEPLAWSEDQLGNDAGYDIAPGAHSDVDDRDPLDSARPSVHFDHDEDSALGGAAPLPWYRRPGVLFAAAACAVLFASVGLIVTWKVADVPATPVVTTATTTPTAAPAPPPAPVVAPPPQETVVVQRPAIQPPRRQQAPAPQVAPPPPGPTPVTSSTVVTSTVVSTTPVETSIPIPVPTPTEECTPPGCLPVTECDPATCIIDGPIPDVTDGSSSQGGGGGIPGGTAEGGQSQGTGEANSPDSIDVSGQLGTGPEIDCPGYAGCDAP